MNRTVLSLVTMVVLTSTVAIAGGNPKKVVAVRTPVAPTTDGVMNEPEWKSAVPASGFLQQDPDEGAPATMPAEIYVLYDDEAPYFGCVMHDSDPSKIIGRLGRRGVDVVALRLDPYHDHQTAFEFTFTPSGSKTDLILSNDAELGGDTSWDVVWDLKNEYQRQGKVREFPQNDCLRPVYSVVRILETCFQRSGVQLQCTLRWEYLPGSTLSMVWSHARTGKNGT